VGNVALVTELSVTAQLAPAWFTVTAWPATLAVNVRLAGSVLAGIVSETSPLPVPAAGIAPSPDAVHAQVELGVSTCMVVAPAAGDTVSTDGLMANPQLDPNWVMA
jgi:hypothetical protein